MDEPNQGVNLKVITLDRAKAGEPITVDFVNAVNNGWILRIEVFGVEDTGLLVQQAQIKQETVEMFLDVLHAGADLMNRIHEAGANTHQSVLAITQNFMDTLDEHY